MGFLIENHWLRQDGVRCEIAFPVGGCESEELIEPRWWPLPG